MKYALLVGINYSGTDNALKSPSLDVAKIQDTLVGYEIEIITDFTEQKPTKQSILNAFRRLLQHEGTTLFFYYSGHGVESPESIFCADGELITHTEFRELLNSMNSTSTLIAVLDTCYSGDLFDLAHGWNTHGIDTHGTDTHGHVFLLSSSQEDEVSFEYLTRTGPIGGFTRAYLNTLKTPQTWRSLIETITSQLSDQTPVLTTGQEENLDAKFELAVRLFKQSK
jgi:uncharacterized caspase-like protein